MHSKDFTTANEALEQLEQEYNDHFQKKNYDSITIENSSTVIDSIITHNGGGLRSVEENTTSETDRAGLITTFSVPKEWIVMMDKPMDRYMVQHTGRSKGWHHVGSRFGLYFKIPEWHYEWFYPQLIIPDTSGDLILIYSTIMEKTCKTHMATCRITEVNDCSDTVESLYKYDNEPYHEPVAEAPDVCS